MPGGVCAVLDYEVDAMAEYVAEMAMRIVMPNSTVTGAFRKFVSQILTSTRLPSTTILLGMNFLAKRVNMLNAQGHFKAAEGQTWRMLTVALLLGSKFLDDNTFQNRSWSEVSGIPVVELNQIEFEWLKHINWHLYVNLDESKDYTAWLKNWADWSDNKKRQQHQAQLAQQQTLARERLAPIVTNIRTDMSRRSHHGLAYQGWSPEEMHDAEAFNTRLLNSTKAYRQRENAWSTQYQNGWASQAPLTPPDSGYGTPEYLNSAPPVNPRFDWASATGNYHRGYQSGSHGNYNSARGGLHYPQPYYPHYSQGGWDANLAECNCHNCLGSIHSKSANYYHMPQHSFGQAVMG